LHAVLDTVEVVRHVVIFQARIREKRWCSAGHPANSLPPGPFGADRRAGDRTADGRDVIAASAADLVSRDTPPMMPPMMAPGTLRAAAVVDDLLDARPSNVAPARLDRTDRRHVRLIDTLIGTPAVFSSWVAPWRRTFVRMHRRGDGPRDEIALFISIDLSES
jgi:hypothetical protein